ncbi:MAG: GIY-YIG nuclease family protein [Patescibacteria group bacterium]
MRQERQYCVYIMTNKTNTVLYIGVTGHLEGRVYQHKIKAVKGFTSKYNINKLVYYEVFDNPMDAIAREKQLKAGSRRKKVQLIEKDNKQWKDLAVDWYQ